MARKTAAAAVSVAPAPSAEPEPLTQGDYQVIDLGHLVESPKNNRKHFDQVKLEQLADNIRKMGVLTPLLARPIGRDGTIFELAAGHRRYRAAQMAGIEKVPVVVREMDDVTFLEVLNIENLQRDDLHPLEEAQGYKDLIDDAGYSAARIGERVGKSEKYVWDRVKLLQLTKEAQKLFLENRFTAAHAILLARLKPADQERAIDPYGSALWRGENTLWHPDSDDKHKGGKYDELTPRSVRELEAWIDRHVRLDPRRDVDPLIFPEIADVVVSAKEMNLKVIPITYEHQLPEDAKAEERTYSRPTWKRADGKRGSKTCEHAVVGYIAAGPGRGEAFSVCIRKDKCAVHWPAEVKAANARAKAKKSAAVAASPEASPAAKAKAERDARIANEEQARAELEGKRWKKAKPEVLKRVAAHIAKSATSAQSKLGVLILSEVSDRELSIDPAIDKLACKLIPGTSTDSLVRYLAFAIVARVIADEWEDFDDKVKVCKDVGFDLEKALDDIEPLPEPEKPAPKKAPAKKRR